MKNLGKNLLLVILLFGTMSMKANTNSKDSEIKRSVTILKYTHVKEGNKITIKDIYGVVLYDEAIQTDGKYIKGFDLTTLPKGNYTFELDKGLEIQVKPFTVKAGKVEFLNGEGHTIYKPVIRKKNGLVFVSQLTFDEEVEIKILNNTNNILYAELVDTNIELRKIFDFSELPFNDYTVIIKTQNRRFINHITL